jgi:hypothetical protein
MREFLTFNSHFSLSLRDCTNYSLFTLSVSFFTLNFSLFTRISHFSSRPHSHACRPFSCRRPALLTSALPMTWLLPRPPCRRAIIVRSSLKSEKFAEKWEFCWKSGQKWEIRSKSEKFAGKVAKLRNSTQKWEIRWKSGKIEKFDPKVRNSLEMWPKERNSTQKWEIRVWDWVRNLSFKMYHSEKFAR